MGILGESQISARQPQADQTRPKLPRVTEFQTQPREVWNLLSVAQQQQVLQIITSTCCSLVSHQSSNSLEDGSRP